MKQILIILVVGGVLFAGSAGLSVYLQQLNQPLVVPDGDKPAKFGQPLPSGDKEPGEGGTAAPLRPLPSLNPENVVALAEKIRQQQEALRLREQQFATRQKSFEVVLLDMKGLQKTYDAKAEELNALKKEIMDKIELLDRKSGDLSKLHLDHQDKLVEVQNTMSTLERVEMKNFKPLFDKMDPPIAGEMLQEMADKGKMDMAARILVTLKDSQAAAVLAQIPDRSVAVQLIEHMRGLKRPGKAPEGEN